MNLDNMANDLARKVCLRLFVAGEDIFIPRVRPMIRQALEDAYKAGEWSITPLLDKPISHKKDSL